MVVLSGGALDTQAVFLRSDCTEEAHRIVNDAGQVAGLEQRGLNFTVAGHLGAGTYYIIALLAAEFVRLGRELDRDTCHVALPDFDRGRIVSARCEPVGAVVSHLSAVRAVETDIRAPRHLDK